MDLRAFGQVGLGFRIVEYCLEWKGRRGLWALGG